MNGLFQMQNQNPQQAQSAPMQQGGYASILSQRTGGAGAGGLNKGLGAGLGGFGSMQGGFGGGGGLPFNISGYGGMEAGLGGMGGFGGGMGGFNPMMGGYGGGMGGFNSMLGGYGGFGGFNPMMGGYGGGMGGFNPMMGMGLGSFGGFGGGMGGGFNPMMGGGFGGFGGFNPMMGGGFGGGFQTAIPSAQRQAQQQALMMQRGREQHGEQMAPTGPHGGYDMHGRLMGGNFNRPVEPFSQELPRQQLMPTNMQNLFGGNQFDQRQAQQQALMMQRGREQQPPPGMMVNPNYDRARAMQDNVDLPGTPGYLARQPFIPANQQPPPGMMENPLYRGDLPSGTAGIMGGETTMRYTMTPEAKAQYIKQLEQSGTPAQTYSFGP